MGISRPNPGDPDPLDRDNLPGELEHASGQEEEFEASIVAGGGGDPISDDEAAAFDEILAEQAEDAYATPATPALRPEATAPTTAKGPARFVAFLRASWAELQRVQWPDRRQVGQATAVVLGFVVIAGLYLGLADYVAKKFVDFIL